MLGRIKILEKDNSDLSEEIETLEERVMRQDEIITKMCSILEDLNYDSDDLNKELGIRYDSKIIILTIIVSTWAPPTPQAGSPLSFRRVRRGVDNESSRILGPSCKTVSSHLALD